jgi:hypothetical protein
MIDDLSIGRIIETSIHRIIVEPLDHLSSLRCGGACRAASAFHTSMTR